MATAKLITMAIARRLTTLSRSNSRVLRGVIFAIIILVAGLFVLWFYLNESSDAWGKRIIEKIKNERSRPERFELVRELVRKTGPENSIALLSVIRQDDLDLFGASEIHLLMHVVGEETYEEYKNEKAILKCERDMLNGCMHGVWLSAMSDVGAEGVREIINSCRKNQPPYKFKIRCVHGAGHGFMAASDYRDLPGALKMCDSLEGLTSNELRSCYYAVFMENVFGEHDGITPQSHPWLKRDDLLFPCNAVEAKYKNQCYNLQPSWWYTNLRDVQKTADECGRVPVAHREACAEGLGLLMSVINKTRTTNADGVFSNCKKYLKEDELVDSCLLLTSEGRLTVYEISLASRLCEKISENDKKEMCYGNIISFLKGDAPDSEIREICARFELSFRHLCGNL